MPLLESERDEMKPHVIPSAFYQNLEENPNFKLGTETNEGKNNLKVDNWVKHNFEAEP